VRRRSLTDLSVLGKTPDEGGPRRSGEQVAEEQWGQAVHGTCHPVPGTAWHVPCTGLAKGCHGILRFGEPYTNQMAR